jgi:hypothetical protein
VEVRDSDKHSSLSRCVISYCGKKIYSADPKTQMSDKTVLQLCLECSFARVMNILQFKTCFFRTAQKFMNFAKKLDLVGKDGLGFIQGQGPVS